MTVLVVDDHEGIRLLLRRLLAAVERCEIIAEATDGAEAVELARTLQPDLIIMDYEMPALNGLDALERVRAFLPYVQVFMYTSSRMPCDAEMLRRGASAVFHKDEIDALIEAVLDSTRMPPA